MAPFKEFRELAAWRLAHLMNLRVDVFLGCPEFRQHFKSCRQLAAAARSGPRHIAEGSARLKHQDFAQLVRNARESEIQVLNHLIDAHDQRLISTDELLINRLLAKRALRAASGLIRYLESTPDEKVS
jgi:four helix bundle protein